MTRVRAVIVALVAVAAVLALPAAASAHAYLIRTVPAASGVLESPPATVQLTYDEAVEPRFAIISVTDAAGHQVTTGPVQRSPANPDTLVVTLRPHLPEGWYLIY
jgi:copper transport protein